MSSSAYAAATQEVGRLRVQRTEGFRELARLKLDTITQHKVVEHRLDAAERQPSALLNSRQEALRQIPKQAPSGGGGVRQVAEAARQAAWRTEDKR